MMDELKSKVLNFVKKQSNHSLEISSEISDQLNDDDLIKINEAAKRPRPQSEPEEDVLEDEEVLKQIDENYFNPSEDFDVKLYQLKKLPEILNCQDLKKDLKVLYRQHGVISKKILQLILEKESQCKTELTRISQLQENIGDALKICQEGRKHLNTTKQQFTTASLGILANYKRKQSICQLLKSLNMIKTLQRTNERLQELLDEENYSGAINLLLECQIVASNFSHFKCVAQLSCKLQDTLYMTEEQLDIALSKICRKFNYSTYSKLQDAYGLLDKTQTVMDQLLMHFTSEIHSIVFNTIHGFALTDGENKKQFQQLCKFISTANFIPCLQALCQNMWHVLNSYYQVVQWHQSRDKEQTSTGIPSKDIEINLSKQYVKQKLENGLKRLWNDIQNRISIYLLAHDFAEYKFEELLLILGMVHRMVEIGEEFCGSKSTELEESMKQLTTNYFKNYHTNKLEELRIFLENESWTQCPVRPSFNIMHLQEFRTIRNSIESYRKSKHVKESEKSEADQHSCNASTDGNSYQNYNYFGKYQDSNETPFDSNFDDSFEEDILNSVGGAKRLKLKWEYEELRKLGGKNWTMLAQDRKLWKSEAKDFVTPHDEMTEYVSDGSDDSECEELKKDFVEENPCNETGNKRPKKQDRSSNKENSPKLANTTLSVLRLCGKYLQMCKLLKPIALDVIVSMCQLFDYYLYNVCRFFTNGLPVQSASMFSFKIQTTMKRIEEDLIINEAAENDPEENKGKIVPSKLSEMVNLTERETIFGLSQRVVAVESLVFLGSQFEYIQPYITHLVPDQKKHLIHHFYLQTVSCLPDLRRPAYMCVSARVIDMQQILKEMSKVNFEVKEVMSQHSPYVDRIVRDLQIFAMELESVDIHIPVEAYNVLWENVVHIVNNTLVEGFSNVKKCSNGGRALMQLDYTQFICKLEKLTTLRPIPNREFVDLYVKAYYLQENNLEEWIKQHKEYTSKQLEALVQCSCQNSRKTKQKLLQMLEMGK